MATMIEELERLASLRDRGMLTPQEFERQKASLFDGSGGSAPPMPNFPDFPDFPDLSPGEAAIPFANPGQPQRDNNKTLFIVLGVIGGVIVLFIIVALIAGGSRRTTRPYYNAGTRYYSSPYYPPRTRSYPSNSYSNPPSSYPNNRRPVRRYPH